MSATTIGIIGISIFIGACISESDFGLIVGLLMIGFAFFGGV